MLANPILVPAYADPIHWAIALFAMGAEIATELAMLRRIGLAADLRRLLVLFNCMTWLAFLIALDAWGGGGIPLIWTVTLLEVAVVVVEALLLWCALRMVARCGSGAEVAITRLIAIATTGNLVSILASLAIGTTIGWILR